jgi:hypothetical protein
VLQGVHKAKNRLSVENETVKRKECVEKFLLNKSLSSNFIRDSVFGRSVSKSSLGETTT